MLCSWTGISARGVNAPFRFLRLRISGVEHTKGPGGGHGRLGGCVGGWVGYIATHFSSFQHQCIPYHGARIRDQNHTAITIPTTITPREEENAKEERERRIWFAIRGTGREGV